MRFRFLFCPVMVMASEWMPLHSNDSSMAEIRSFEQNQIDAILADAARSLAEDRPDEAMRLLDKHQARLAKTAATECRAAVLASRALELTGEMEAAKQRAVEAERLAVSCDDLLCQAESVEMQGKVALRQRDLPVCIRFFERAIPLWQRAQKSSEALTQRGLARTLIGLTYGTLAARQLSVARGHVVEAVRVARLAQQPRILGNALNAAGAVYQALAVSHHPSYAEGDSITVLDPCADPLVQRYAQAGIATCVEAAQHALDAGSELDYVMMQSNSATFENLAGRTETALAKHEALVKFCRRSGHKYLLTSALQMVGWSLRILGRNQEAENTLQEALAIAKDANTRDIVLSLHYDLSLVYEQLGQPNKALFHLREYIRRDAPRTPSVAPIASPPSAKAADVEMHEALLEDTGVKEPNRPLIGVTSYDPSHVFRAESYINAHLRERIAVADVARHAGVSVRNLQLAFMRHRTQSPLAFILAARLSAAHKYMLQPRSQKITVAEVAEYWGFENVSRFSRAYKAQYGKSPAETLAG